MTPVLRERIEDGIEVVRLNRPDKRNALDSPALAVLNDALDDLAADDSLRALVLSTTNVRAFCAGADVGEALDQDGGVARMAAFTRMYSAIDAFSVPVIAVCVGNCVGAGAEIVAGADLRVGGDNLKLAWAGARLGVPVGPARLAPLIGVARAKDLVFTGRSIGLGEAAALGLLHRTAAADEAEAVAIEVARAVAAQSPRGVRVLKQMFRELDRTGDRVAYENEHLMRFQQHGAGLPRGR
ncbi:MAG TPA: enoyl-CoA hydratase/isomerase family protein [Jatrophihabitans sp.]|jgi:enoyl-CoA hydratase/carnithine racemase|uniref:enoyl-CoA hydratase/isomerase family protein n=1 Tax=Jatrophihabitans sp. TaxID=1932789 RepID=UPI002DF8944C|nr:enoyl-CoA hydratase/isomerase family protein [Jatrophihabitans sp.]